MQKTVNLVLFSKKHLKGLVLEVQSSLNVNEVFFINPFESGKGFLTLFYKIKNGTFNDVYIFLDYRPLIIQVLLALVNNFKHTSVFVQHGYFETRGKRNLNRRTLMWYINSIYFTLLYIVFGANDNIGLFRRLGLSIRMLSRGAAHEIKNISNDLTWDYAFLYDSSSSRIFQNEFGGKFGSKCVTGTLDKKVFIYDERGINLYVSQPLHLTGHVTAESYKNYLRKIFESTSDLYFLIHPKIEIEWIYDVVDSSRILTKNDVMQNFKVKSLIGHFSSILLGLDESIKLRIDDQIGNEVIEECKIFNPRDKIKFNGLNTINNILEGAN